jgi:hypothetical protein
MKKNKVGRPKVAAPDKKVPLTVTVRQRHRAALLAIVKKTVTDYERKCSAGQHHP